MAGQGSRRTQARTYILSYARTYTRQCTVMITQCLCPPPPPPCSHTCCMQGRLQGEKGGFRAECTATRTTIGRASTAQLQETPLLSVYSICFADLVVYHFDGFSNALSDDGDCGGLQLDARTARMACTCMHGRSSWMLCTDMRTRRLVSSSLQLQHDGVICGAWVCISSRIRVDACTRTCIIAAPSRS